MALQKLNFVLLYSSSPYFTLYGFSVRLAFTHHSLFGMQHKVFEIAENEVNYMHCDQVALPLFDCMITIG